MTGDRFSIFAVTREWASEKRIELHAFETTTSTNDLAKQNPADGHSKILIYLADQQSSGRGRSNNIWFNSEVGSSLLSSWLFSLTASPQHLTGPLFGLALYQTVREVWPDPLWSLKAPNDLLLNGKKVAGLLIENLAQGSRNQLIVGLGLNVFSHPQNVDSASNLSHHFPVTRLKWIHFLNSLKIHFALAATDCLLPELNSQKTVELLAALNSNPHLKEKFKSVSKSGDLVGPHSTHSWQNI